MDVLLTYDISMRHGEVKEAMKKKGYNDHWFGSVSKKTYWLPDTSLWKKNVVAATAKADIQQVILDLNAGQPYSKQIRLERCVAVNFDDSTGWAAILGETHS